MVASIDIHFNPLLYEKKTRRENALKQNYELRAVVEMQEENSTSNNDKKYDSLKCSKSNVTDDKPVVSIIKVQSAFKRYQRPSDGKEDSSAVVVTDKDEKYRRQGIVSPDGHEDTRRVYNTGNGSNNAREIFVIKDKTDVLEGDNSSSISVNNTGRDVNVCQSEPKFLARIDNNCLRDETAVSPGTCTERILSSNSSSTSTTPFTEIVGLAESNTIKRHESPDLTKQQQKRTLVVYPQPRMANIPSQQPSSRNVWLHKQFPIQLRGYLPGPPKLIPCPTFASRSPDVHKNDRELLLQDSKISLVNNARSLQSQRFVTATITQPQTSSCHELLENDRALSERALKQTFHQQNLLTSASETGGGDGVKSCKTNSTESVKRRKPYEYSIVNLTKGTRISWCHKRALLASRIYRNLPSDVGHICAYNESGTIPNISSEIKYQSIRRANVANSPPQIITMKNNRIIDRSPAIQPRKYASSENDSPIVRDNIRDSPPAVELVSDKTPVIDLCLMESNFSPPLQLKPGDDLSINKRTESEIIPIFSTLPRRSSQFSWKSQDISLTNRTEETSEETEENPRKNETKVDQYENVTESNTETSTTDNNSQSLDTDMDEEENYDSDASIDVGDSYDPDPHLATMDFDIQADDNDYYDAFQDDDGEDDDEKYSESSERYIGGSGQDIQSSNSGYNMGAVITSSPIDNSALDETTSESANNNELKRKMNDGASESGVSKKRYVIVESQTGIIARDDVDWKARNERVHGSNDTLSKNSGADSYSVISDEEFSNDVSARGYIAQDSSKHSGTNVSDDEFYNRYSTSALISQRLAMNMGAFVSDREYSSPKDSRLKSHSNEELCSNKAYASEIAMNNFRGLQSYRVVNDDEFGNHISPRSFMPMESSRIIMGNDEFSDRTKNLGSDIGFNLERKSRMKSLSDEEGVGITNEEKAKGNKGTKSRGVYRELGMRSGSENLEELGEFYPIYREAGVTKSPAVLLSETSSKIMLIHKSEVSDQELAFSLADTALRCRMLVVLWAILGESRLRQVGFPKEPIHRLLWRTVDVCCSVAGVKSAAAVPLAADHDCGRDMVCFRDHAHRFLEVCAPTREHWKRFGWASLTVDAVVRKIYIGE